MDTSLKANPTVPMADENPLLAKFERSMATIWNCPEVKPLPRAPHNTRKIFDRLHRMSKDGMPEPSVIPDDGELLVEWESDSNVSLFLHVNLVTLHALITVADLDTMQSEGIHISLKTPSGWQKVETELQNVMGYRRR